MKVTPEHPIIFSPAMVRALLAGRKTQTRRVVRPQPDRETIEYVAGAWPYGQRGDQLWVREGLVRGRHGWTYGADSVPLEVRLGEEPAALAWAERNLAKRHCPSIHMPRWASRIRLELVDDVRAERLHELTEEGALAEGVDPRDGRTARESFGFLWNQYNGGVDDTWSANPFVWVMTFRVLEPQRRPAYCCGICGADDHTAPGHPAEASP